MSGLRPALVVTVPLEGSTRIEVVGALPGPDLDRLAVWVDGNPLRAAAVAALGRLRHAERTLVGEADSEDAWQLIVSAASSSADVVVLEAARAARVPWGSSNRGQRLAPIVAKPAAAAWILWALERWPASEPRFGCYLWALVRAERPELLDAGSHEGRTK